MSSIHVCARLGWRGWKFGVKASFATRFFFFHILVKLNRLIPTKFRWNSELKSWRGTKSRHNVSFFENEAGALPLINKRKSNIIYYIPGSKIKGQQRQKKTISVS